MFTDAYGEQSCTAGRASLITGQSVYRTGLSKVGLPGATDKYDPTEQPRWGRVGKQTIKDTGALNRKRMETCDDEFVGAAKDFIKRQHGAGTPFFVWLNTTHMHCRTHTKPSSLGQTGEGQSPYHDTMIDHDKNVGEMLDYLDELGITDNTFVKPADGSLRTCRHHVEHLLGLVHVQGLHDHGRAGGCAALPHYVQGLSATAEGGELHARSGAGKDASDVQLRPLSPLSHASGSALDPDAHQPGR